MRRRTCGHGTTDTEHGPAGRCERCDLTAKLVMRLRQASAIAELLGYVSVRDELSAIAATPAVHDGRLAEARRPKAPKPAEVARRAAALPPATRAQPSTAAIAAASLLADSAPDWSRPPEAYERIGGGDRGWMDRNRW
ncbi:MAG: hypothetical protein AABM40_05845 [Chloroflexota bacterium]